MNNIRPLGTQKSPIKLEEIPSVLRKLRVRIDFFDRQSIDVDAVVQVVFDILFSSKNLLISLKWPFI